MQHVTDQIKKAYDIDIKNISPFRDYYILDTSRGKKILKKPSLNEERINFIHHAKRHIYDNNFKNIDLYDITTNNTPFFNIDGINYTMTDMIEGVECDFDNREHVILATKALSAMHKASKGYSYPEDSIPRSELGMLPGFFQKRLDEIKKLKKVALKGKLKFDFKVLEHIDYFYSLGNEALSDILNSKYFELVEQTKNEKYLCHHDFTHTNIIINKQGAFIINFEYCTYELKIYDIANLLKRKLRKCSWDINEAKIILDEYRSIGPITNEEFFIMKAMLKFPQKFWRVINKYYNSKKSWSEKYYLGKLDEVIAEIECSKNLISNFNLLI